MHESDEFTKALEGNLKLWPMTEPQSTHFLNYCVTGRDQVIGIAENKRDLDYAVGSVEMRPHAGIVGDLYAKVVAVLGWPNDGTVPQMFDSVLKQVNCQLRMQHRFIYLSPADGVKALRNKQKDWFQINGWSPKRIGMLLASCLMPINTNDKRVVPVNTDTDNQGDSIEQEIELVQSGTLRLGYYTMNVVVYHQEKEQVEKYAKQVVQEISRLGFTAAVETLNAADAYAGTWPGNGSKGIRKYYFNSRQLARLLPTSTQWTGEDKAPCPHYSGGALTITTSSGNTPFYLNVHEGDVGNFLIIGPTGNGKTYAVNSLALGFRQYLNSQINLFDRDYGAIIPTLACGGQFYSAEAMRYAPFAHLDEQEEKEWALRFVETLATLQNHQVTPIAKQDLKIALETVSTAAPKHRHMTGFHSQLQTHVPGLKAAIGAYVGGILDGEPGPEQEASWQTWDMLKLLGQGEAISTPVIMFLIHQIQRRLDGRPTLTIFEEGWMVAANEHLDSYTTASSANYRKQVNALGLVLHSPENLLEFTRHQLLLTNTPTIIYLPNPRAMTERQGYERLGLGRREIKMIAEDLVPRRDYYMVKGDKRRVFRFEHGRLGHALLSANGRDHKERVLALQRVHGQAWVAPWLRERQQPELAEQWLERYQQQVKEAA